MAEIRSKAMADNSIFSNGGSSFAYECVFETFPPNVSRKAVNMA